MCTVVGIAAVVSIIVAQTTSRMHLHSQCLLPVNTQIPVKVCVRVSGNLCMRSSPQLEHFSRGQFCYNCHSVAVDYHCYGCHCCCSYEKKVASEEQQ